MTSQKTKQSMTRTTDQDRDRVDSLCARIMGIESYIYHAIFDTGDRMNKLEDALKALEAKCAAQEQEIKSLEGQIAIWKKMFNALGGSSK